MKKQNRRNFLQFLGRSGVVVTAGAVLPITNSCGTPSEKKKEGEEDSTTIKETTTFPIKGIQPQQADELILA